MTKTLIRKGSKCQSEHSCLRQVIPAAFHRVDIDIKTRRNEMNITELIAKADKEFREARAMGEAICNQAKAEGRANLTLDETRETEAYLEQAQSARARKDALKVILDEETAADKRANDVHPTGVKVPGKASVSVGREARTYNQGVDAERGMKNNPGSAFLVDVGAAFYGDVTAQERLQRHMREERVERPWLNERANSSTASFTGLVVPQYVVDDAAPAVTAARPLADVITGRDLPPTGMSVNLSRITTPTAAGIQTSENTAVTSQAIADTLLTIPVLTAAGYVQLSRQAIERGLLTEDITVADLLTRVAVSLENQMISQATVGLAAVATSQTYTNATVDTTAVPAFLKQLPQAQNSLETALLTRARPGVVVLHPRRYNWLTAAVSASWPTMSGSVPVQSGGLIVSTEYGSVRAHMPNGMRIVADANVTTTGLATALTGGTQDHCYVLSAEESYLYEPPERVVTIRAEQPSANQLGVLFVASEYFAYSFARYTGQAVLVNGTGLASPTFV